VKLGAKSLIIVFISVTLIVLGYSLIKIVFFKSTDTLFKYAPQVKKVKLYFVNQDGKLQAEKREIQGGGSIQEDVKLCIEELAAGPKEKGLMRSLPPLVFIKGVYLDENRCIYLDFNKSITEKPVGGTKREQQMIYSLVNTILDNFGQLNSVKILVDGQEIKTLGGHLDVNQPLRSKKLE